MNSLYIELKAGNSSQAVERSLKVGNTYIFFVKADFDSKNRNDLNDLARALNIQLEKDRIEQVDFKKIERELMRVKVGRRIDIRI